MENTDHLANWSRLENGITLNALKRAAYTSMLARGPQVESFATWLMAGAGATAGLLVANIGSVTDAIGRGGVQWVLYSLTASIFFGLASKAFAVFIPSNAAQIADARASIAAVLERHGAKRKEIEAMAQKNGVSAPASFTAEEMMTELCRPFPWFGKLITLYVMRKQLASKEQNGDLLLGLSGLRLQLNMCVFQLAASLTALVSVAIHVLG